MTWRKRINQAARRGKFTDEDLDDSAKWNSCAVGEKFCLENPELRSKASKSSPYVFLAIGNHASELGSDFHDAVERNDIERAEEIYRKIQDIEVTY